MAEQVLFTFVPLAGDVVSFARMGLRLNWRRVELRAARLFARHLAQVSGVESKNALLAAAFAWRRHFRDVALYEEIRRGCLQRGRALKREARQSGRRLSGSVVLVCTPEGQRAQMVLDQLSEQLQAWEAVALCG